MANLIAIAAVGKNMELGTGGDLVWRIDEDLQFFRKSTLGKYIVMGRKTYDSMPKRLNERQYLVISRGTPQTQGLKTFANVEEFLDFSGTIDENIFVIGGGEIYKQLLPFCSKMILTHINQTSPHADVIFPAFDQNQWDVTECQNFKENDITYTRITYERQQEQIPPNITTEAR